MLLKEKSSIESSIRTADESLEYIFWISIHLFISQASAVRQSLLNQREIFNRVGNNVSTLLAKFPVLNNLLGNIKNARRKDMIIIGLVISACIILILLYVLN